MQRHSDIRCHRKSDELFHVGQTAGLARLRRHAAVEIERILIWHQWVINYHV